MDPTNSRAFLDKQLGRSWIFFSTDCANMQRDFCLFCFDLALKEPVALSMRFCRSHLKYDMILEVIQVSRA